MNYKLVNIKTNESTEGSISVLQQWNCARGVFNYISNATPMIGAKLRVGSYNSIGEDRKVHTTNIINDIKEETDDYIIFSTIDNNIYMWKKYSCI